jgi:hypothetical protein
MNFCRIKSVDSNSAILISSSNSNSSKRPRSEEEEDTDDLDDVFIVKSRKRRGYRPEGFNMLDFPFQL